MNKLLVITFLVGVVLALTSSYYILADNISINSPNFVIAELSLIIGGFLVMLTGTIGIRKFVQALSR